MGKKVTKNDIVDSLYSKMNCERKVIYSVIDNFLDEISASLEEGSTIELRGFGTFETKLRKGRENARNPKTGELLTVDSHYVASFRAGRDLKNNLLKLKTSDEK